MGYVTDTLLRLQRLAERGHLRPGMTIADFGDQTLQLNQPEDLEKAKAFIRTFNPDWREKTLYDGPFPMPIHMAPIFREAGFEYASFDLNGYGGSFVLDLNSPRIEHSMRGKVDLLMNQGTTEHVVNQMTAFFHAHELTKVGGVMWHDVPVSGFGAHALMAATPLFWKYLVDYNGYDVLLAKVRSIEKRSHGGQVFHYDDRLDFIERLSGLVTEGLMLDIQLRKTSDHVFLTPMDTNAPSLSVVKTLASCIEQLYGESESTEKIGRSLEAFCGKWSPQTQVLWPQDGQAKGTASLRFLPKDPSVAT